MSGWERARVGPLFAGLVAACGGGTQPGEAQEPPPAAPPQVDASTGDAKSSDASEACSEGGCVAPTCTDRLANGSESDVDCGGGSCAACADGKRCARATDCASGACAGGVCQATNCSDKVKNGSEIDVDCGGSCPARCADGSDCKVDADCVSGVCRSAICQAPRCDDGAKNGSESDVDCGGTCPARCANGKRCGGASDCESRACTGNLCVAPTCADTLLNGSETDLDCGGSCTPCGTGKRCRQAADCANAVCEGDICQAPSCTDGKKNGLEADVDCGGTCAQTCVTGKSCSKRSDCTTRVCTGGSCAELPTPQRLVFVTSKTYTPVFGGLLAADDECQAEADRADLPGVWKAFLSDYRTKAVDRLTRVGSPYARVDGTVVANSWTDLLSGSLRAPINKTADGQTPAGDAAGTCSYNDAVFTNTYSNGTILPGGTDWTVNAPTITCLVGRWGRTDSAWIGACQAGGCYGKGALYCVQQ